ncbi:MAG TPA: hypothetical protein VMZ28_29760 [Kofleriaceae bacterium]|nr:hypothetical protein [Kofleriaceae bacterium]
MAMALQGCGDDTGRTEVLQPRGGGAPRYGTAPFPSEAWRLADGRMAAIEGLDALLPRDADLLAAHIARLDGAGLRPVVEFPLSGPIDPTTLPARTATSGDAAAVIDVDPESPELGRVIPYEWRYDEAALVVRGAAVPGNVLRPGTLYAAVLSTDVRDAEGRQLAIPTALRVLMRGDAPAPWTTTAQALARLTADPAWQGGDRIAGAAVFRTQRALRTLLAARAALEDPAQVPLPELSFPDAGFLFKGRAALDRLLGVATRFEDGPRAGQERWGFSNPTGIAHEHVGVIASGRLSMARFRRPEQDGDTPDDMTFELDPVTGAPSVQAIDSVPVTFVLPAADAPASGYPVAIFGHGLGASRAAVVSFAEPLARAGYAVVAIDFDQHGSRYDARDIVNNLAGDLPDFSGVGDMPDGFGDRTGLVTTFAALGGLRNMSAARDAIGQNVLDLSQLVRFLRHGEVDLAPLRRGARPVPHLDPDQVVYLGESFGTISGGVLAALEPEIDLFVLDVPGAAMVDLAIAGSPEMSTLLLPLLEVIYGLAGPVDRFHPVVGLVQSLVDAVDPMSWAPFVLRERLTVAGRPNGPRHLVALEVVGDEVIPNQATEAWARVVGLEVLTPHMEVPEGIAEVASPAAGNVDGQTGVLVHYSPATHGANWTSEWGALRFEPGWPFEGAEKYPERAEPLVIANPIYETLDQVVEILDTHRTDGVPVVRSTQAPAPP